MVNGLPGGGRRGAKPTHNHKKKSMTGLLLSNGIDGLSHASQQQMTKKEMPSGTHRRLKQKNKTTGIKRKRPPLTRKRGGKHRE